MQSQLMAKILELQGLTGRLREQLESTQASLAETEDEAARMSREKDDMIASLTQRIQSMEGSYEAVLNVRILGASRAVTVLIFVAGQMSITICSLPPEPLLPFPSPASALRTSFVFFQGSRSVSIHLLAGLAVM